MIKYKKNFAEYQLIIYGGGTAGTAAAYTAAKKGIKTLLVEKTDVLGGAASQGLVMPVMKSGAGNINTEYASDLKVYADKYGCRHAYIDGNDLWLNPELLKIVLDNMMKDSGCDILFSSQPVKAFYNKDLNVFEQTIRHKFVSIDAHSKYIIDASSEGVIFKLLDCSFQEKSADFQASSLRFIMSGINMQAFADWLEKFDEDRNVTTIERAENQIYLSTACTWDGNRNWALRPIFEKAVQENCLQYEDTAYFQVFSIPSMPDSLNFNAPRIILKDGESIDNPFIYSKALMQGRERIFRLYKFCRKYLKGFENSYISHISDMLGVRESNRVKCRYTVTLDDIINPKEFENPAFACSYPVDIHSNSVKKDTVQHNMKTYYVPIDALISKEYSSLYGIGRIISSDFKAHSALRTQMSCFSMGEAAAKDIYKKIDTGS